MPTGVVVKWIAAKGIGFIKPDDGGADVFVHVKCLDGIDFLDMGDTVNYDLQFNDRMDKYECSYCQKTGSGGGDGGGFGGGKGKGYGGGKGVGKGFDKGFDGGKGKGKGKGKSKAPGAKPDGCMSVIVKGLSFDATEEDLQREFQDCGRGPINVKLLRHSDTGRSKGMAFVDFNDERAVEQAMSHAGNVLCGRDFFMDYARPRV